MPARQVGGFPRRTYAGGGAGLAARASCASQRFCNLAEILELGRDVLLGHGVEALQALVEAVLGLDHPLDVVRAVHGGFLAQPPPLGKGTPRAASRDMEDLRVPKRSVPVEVVLPGGEARQVLLSEGAASHPGPERLSDLLNGTAPFIPARESGSGAMTFLHRASIAVARVASRRSRPTADSFTIPTEHEVEITLADGARLSGLVAYVAPQSRERLVDFLNRPEPFLRLLERDRVALVGRAHAGPGRTAPEVIEMARLDAFIERLKGTATAEILFQTSHGAVLSVDGEQRVLVRQALSTPRDRRRLRRESSPAEMQAGFPRPGGRSSPTRLRRAP